MFGLDVYHFTLALLITLLAGFVKGAVGFAQPMIMISGLATFLPPEIALAALIVPTVVTNVWQSMRGGLSAAIASLKRFWVFLLLVVIFIVLSAQLVSIIPGWVMLLILGVPITLFAIAQLVGWKPSIAPENRFKAELGLGAFAGFVGGMSGVWGPPTVVYLTAIETPKAEQMRVQGVIYGIGAVTLFFAHLRSGVLNTETFPLSLAMVLPALAGMGLGFAVHDRLDQQRFRQITLAVLIVAGLNLIRRAVM